MQPFRPLLAAIDWIEIAIFLFIVGSSLVGQLFRAANQQQRKKAHRVPRPPVPPPQARPDAPQARQAAGQPPVAGQPARQLAAGQAPPAAPGRPKTALEKEIEAFLRRSTAEQPAAGRTPVRRTETRSGQQPAQAQRQPSKPAAARSVESDRTFPPKESVTEHVQRHVLKGSVADRDAHLAKQLEQSDERLESHLQDVFQHRLGSLQRDSAQADAAISPGTDATVWSGQRSAHPLAAELYELLATPQRVQTAILLSEILRRPDDRWD